MTLEEMKQLYEVSVNRYNVLVNAINDAYTSLIYLEQFPIVVGSFIDENSLDKVLELGNKVNGLEDDLKEVKKIIKGVVNDAIDQYNEDLTENPDISMASRMKFVGEGFTKDKVQEINNVTDLNINACLDAAKGTDDSSLADKLAGYAAVMKVLINERNKDIEE